MYEALARKLHNVALDVELRIKAELAAQINLLKKERNAVILGHNYMEAALFHSIPDFVGDSLYLSRMAAQTDKEVIVFCGVEFMAETAKILSPDKTVPAAGRKGRLLRWPPASLRRMCAALKISSQVYRWSHTSIPMPM